MRSTRELRVSAWAGVRSIAGPGAQSLAACGAAAIVLMWVLDPSVAGDRVSTGRMLFAGFTLLFLPGIVMLRFARSLQLPWQAAIAVSGALSLCYAAIMLPVPFWVAGGIRTYAIAHLSGILVMAILAFVWPRIRPPSLAGPDRATDAAMASGGEASDLIHAAGIVLFAVAAYGFGEQVGDVGFEKVLHLQFVRLYFEREARLADLGYLPGAVPPNVIHLWEYLIAAWASMAHADPLSVFERARVAVPILGLASMYLFAWAIFPKRHADVLFTIVLLLALGGFVLNPPSSLEFIRTVDPTRGAFLFYGSAHHADSAMDILVPLLSAVLWLSLSRQGSFWKLLLGGMLVVAFLWHPREYFQLALFLPFAAIAMLCARIESPTRLIPRLLGTGLIVAMVGIAFFAFINLERFSGRIGYDELAIKRDALVSAAQPANLMGFRSALAIPNHLVVANPESNGRFLDAPEIARQFDMEPRTDAWLIVAGLAQIVLLFLGGRSALALAGAHLSTWAMLMWNSASLIAVALTYSEFLMSTSRLLYVLSYLLVAEAAFLLADFVRRFVRASETTGWVSTGIGFGMLFLMGMGGMLVARAGGTSLIAVAGAAVTTGIVAGLLILLCRPRDAERDSIDRHHAAWLTTGSILLLLAWIVPGMQRDSSLLSLLVSGRTNAPIAWMTDSNPFGLSGELIANVRKLPAGSMIAANPLAMPYFPAYAPVYVYPSPFPVLAFLPEHESVKAGQHPLFGARALREDEVLRYVMTNRIQYIVVQAVDYASLGNFLKIRPQRFKVEYEDPTRRNMLVRVRISDRA